MQAENNRAAADPAKIHRLILSRVYHEDILLTQRTYNERLKDLKELKIERPPRVKLSAKESLKRTQEFDKRKERFIAANRKSKSSSLPA